MRTGSCGRRFCFGR